MSTLTHNPGLRSDEETVRDFVVRDEVLRRLTEPLREDGPPRHQLVIGPRGFGKSMLVQRLAAEVRRRSDLGRRWLPVVLAEETYEALDPGELWLAAAERLAMERSALADVVADLRRERDPDRLGERALALLQRVAREGDVRLLVVVENLGMLLAEQMNDAAGWELRHTLSNEPAILLVATATATFDGVEDPSAALYEFFQTTRLAPLSWAECGRVWTSVTKQDIGDDRARAVRILTGGSPRLVAMMARFGRDLDLAGLVEQLTALVDEHTPYFKANIEALPPAERKVFTSLCLLWQPSTAAEIADRARLDSSKASAFLKRLVQRGIVEVHDHEGRRARYRVTERLMCLYVLLRQGRGEQERVRGFLDILAHLVDPSHMEDLAEHAEREADELVRRLARSLLDAATGEAGWYRAFLPAEFADGIGPWLEDPFVDVPQVGVLVAAERHLREVRTDAARMTRQRIAVEVAECEWEIGGPLLHGALRDARSSGSRVEVLLLAGQIARLDVGAQRGRAPAEIEQISQEVIELSGSGSPAALAARLNLVQVLDDDGQTDRALTVLLEVAEDAMPHVETVYLATTRLAAALSRKSGRLDAAVAMLREALATAERAMGADHPTTVGCRSDLAAAMVALAAPETAVRLCLEHPAAASTIVVVLEALAMLGAQRARNLIGNLSWHPSWEVVVVVVHSWAGDPVSGPVEVVEAAQGITRVLVEKSVEFARRATSGAEATGSVERVAGQRSVAS